MKKITVTLAFLCLVMAAFSQTEKGNTLVGVSLGSISYTNSDSKTTYSNTPTIYNSDGSSFSISVNPNIAWFIKDNLAVGGGVSVSFYTSKSNSSNTSSTTTSDNKSTQPSIYIGPLARYYFGAAAKGCLLHRLISSMAFPGVKAKAKPARVQVAKPKQNQRETGMQASHLGMNIL